MEDETGKPAGVFVTCCETTKEVNRLKKLKESHSKFQNTIMQAPVGIIVLKGADFIVETSNDFYLKLVDKTKKEFIGKGLFSSLPEIKKDIEPLLLNVLKTSNPFYGNEFEVTMKVGGKEKKRYFNFIYQPLQDPDTILNRIMVVVSEVTESVLARRKIEARATKVENMFMFTKTVIYSYAGNGNEYESLNHSSPKANNNIANNRDIKIKQETEVIDATGNHSLEYSEKIVTAGIKFIKKKQFKDNREVLGKSRLYIKNMASVRCKMIVEAELEKL